MTALPPIPVSRYLVPDAPATLPQGFTEVAQSLSTGLPFTMTLFRDLALTLALPTGLAAQWRDADALAVVTRSDDQASPRLAAPTLDTLGAVDRAPACLVLTRSGAVLASVPLVAGLRHVLPDSAGGTGGLVELAIVSWDLRAGNVRGAGDYGSRIRLGWREADQAADLFTLPPVDPHVNSRIRDENLPLLMEWRKRWFEEWGWSLPGFLWW